MRLNRPQSAATNSANTTGAVRGRLGATAIRVLSVTAVAAAACSLWAGAASAATSHVKHHTSTTVSASPNPVYVDSPVTLTATVRGWVPTGTVDFYFGTRRLCHASLSKLKAHCTYGGFANAAVKTITAKYLGNSTHAASSGTTKLTVKNKPATTKYATTTTITNTPNPGTVVVGKTFTFDVTVTTSTAGAPAATGTVDVTADGLASDFDCAAPITDGAGTCTITAPQYGAVDYTASYSGDATHGTSTYEGPFELTMMNATTTTVAGSGAAGDVTLTAEVNAGGADIDETSGGTGTVKFYYGPTTADLAPVPNCTVQPLTAFDTSTGNNIATCTSNVVLNALVPGVTVYIYAVYSGDVTNVTSTSPTVTFAPSG